MHQPQASLPFRKPITHHQPHHNHPPPSHHTLFCSSSDTHTHTITSNNHGLPTRLPVSIQQLPTLPHILDTFPDVGTFFFTHPFTRFLFTHTHTHIHTHTHAQVDGTPEPRCGEEALGLHYCHVFVARCCLLCLSKFVQAGGYTERYVGVSAFLVLMSGVCACVSA